MIPLLAGRSWRLNASPLSCAHLRACGEDATAAQTCALFPFVIFRTWSNAAVRDYAFVQLELPRLISLIRLGNLPSRRVAEKIGMHCTAEITRYGRRYWHYRLEREMGDE